MGGDEGEAGDQERSLEAREAMAPPAAPPRERRDGREVAHVTRSAARRGRSGGTRGGLAGSRRPSSTGEHWIDGSITLTPRVHPEYDGFHRAEFGPYALECRTREVWDSNLPEPACVLAYEGETAQVLKLGCTMSWGGPLWAIGGGGRFSVTALSPYGADITYQVADPPPIVAGKDSASRGSAPSVHDGWPHHPDSAR